MNEAIVETKYGKLRGLKRNSQLCGDYYSFLGVPYAQPPVNEFRFKVKYLIN